MNNIAAIRSCKSVENVLNKVNVSEKKKKAEFETKKLSG